MVPDRTVSGSTVFDVAGHGKAISVRYHPLAEGVLAVASGDLSVGIWDLGDPGLAAGSSLPVEPKLTLKGHSQPVGGSSRSLRLLPSVCMKLLSGPAFVPDFVYGVER